MRISAPFRVVNEERFLCPSVTAVSADTAREHGRACLRRAGLCSLVRFDNQDAGNQPSAREVHELIFVLPPDDATRRDAPACNILSSTSDRKYNVTALLVNPVINLAVYFTHIVFPFLLFLRSSPFVSKKTKTI